MEQSIRVTARGEFGQLTRGLKQLRGDLKNVTDEISRGARGGGVFDESQLRALDLFRRRFSETLREIDREFEKQNQIIEDLYKTMENAQQSERDSIRKTIQDRERQLDVLRKQIIETERLFELQNRQIGVPPTAPQPTTPQPTAPQPTTPQPGGGAQPGTRTSVGVPMPGTPQFTQLQRGIKQLQSDLRAVNAEVDKGARRGGVFDESNLNALDIFKRRFQETMNEVDAEFQRQNDIIDALHEKMERAQGKERDAIRDNIKQREKELDVLRQQLYTIERIYAKRTSEASGYDVKQPNPQSIEEEADNSFIGRIMKGVMRSGMLRRGVGLFKGSLALAGIGGLGSMIAESYQQAYGREVNSLDLAQRIRGQAGRTGTATQIYDQSSEVGRRDKMGYDAQETFQFLDQYTRLAGAINTDQQFGLMKFGRAYGLSTSEVAGLVGASRQIGGTTLPKEFADAIAGSVAQSGMTPRIVEVMEANNVLLQQMNTTLKDGSAKQILAYQTTLDRIGLAKGMQQLTGAQGANLISGLGGIFRPGEDHWKWIGIRALQQYDPQKYGNMNLFELEQAFEDGLMNPDNVAAMAEYIRKQTGGNETLAKRILQRWLTDGGFAATKREASEFYDATNGLRVFSPEQLEALRNGSIDSGAKYDQERASEPGQNILDVNARYTKALEGIGSEFIGAITILKEAITDGAEAIRNAFNAVDKVVDGLPFPDWLKQLGADSMEFVEDNPWTVATGAYTGKKAYDVWKARKSKGKSGKVDPSEVRADVGANSKPKTPAPDTNRELPPRSVTHGKAKGKFPKIPGILGWLTLGATAFEVGSNWDAYKPGNEDWGWNWFSLFDPGITAMANSDPIGDQVSRGTESGRISTIAGYSYYSHPDIQAYLKKKEAERKQFIDSIMGTGSGVSSEGGLTDEEIQSIANWLSQQKEPSKDSRWGQRPDGSWGYIEPGEDGYDTALKPAGASDIGRMSEEDYQRFIDMPKKVTTDVESMASEGTDFFLGATREHRDKLQQIYGEHRGLKDFFMGMFDPVIEGFRFVFTNINQFVNNLSAAGSVSGVYSYMNRLGVSTPASTGGSFFSNWQSRVTSRYGDFESFRTKPHGGLDIDGEQGDRLEALADGEVAFIYMDDGGTLDADKKANTRSGGTEVGIRMADGSTYFYSHLSRVNPSLQVGQKVNVGDYIGDLGGDPGKPGSGSSTTGSHLHLGYMDKNGTLMNPEQLLRQLNIGDSDIGKMLSQMPLQNRADLQAVQKTEVTVNVNITGDGASKLNQMTDNQLRRLIKQVFNEERRNQLLGAPTRAGYAQ